MPNPTIISLGGSVIMPERLSFHQSVTGGKTNLEKMRGVTSEHFDNLDLEFLKQFKELILQYIRKGNKFVIYCGGGKLARDYQSIAKKLSNAKETDLDWLGIYATRLNAYLLKSLFGKFTNEEIIINPTKKIDFKKSIAIASGWKPGWSTDYDAVLAAKQLKADTIINVTNVDYVYDNDPRKFKSAKPIKNISWQKFRKLFTEKWQPGLNLPFDPVASKEAERNKIKLIIVGKDIDNLRRVLDGMDFEGSVVE